MSNIKAPADLLYLQVEEFNRGNVSFLMTLDEKDACFASKPGQVVQGLESIRRSLQGFIDMKVKLEARVRRVIQAGNLALLTTEWSIVGTEPDGKPINLNGRGTVVLRSQFDGSWLMVIENPWGTD
ncbi:MAG: nuclear transport factor 2 family protein [Nitrososphaeraceae archaeon]